MDKTVSFDYRPRLGCIVPTGIVFCGLGLLVYVNKAMLARSGVTVYDSRGPVPEWFLWTLSGILAAFLLMWLAGVVAAIKPIRKLIIAETGITCPKNPFARDVTIPFSEISEVTLERGPSNEFIAIRHSGGQVSIPSAFLPYGAFTQIRAGLEEHRRRNAPNAQGPKSVR